LLSKVKYISTATGLDKETKYVVLGEKAKAGGDLSNTKNSWSLPFNGSVWTIKDELKPKA
jgi:hypothetical protein